MFNKVKKFLSEYYNINESIIMPECELVSELGLTSFQLVEMCAQLEDEFDITIDENILPNIITVNDMVVTIENGISNVSI